MKVPIKMKPLIDALKTTYGESNITIEPWKDKEGDMINIILPIYDCEGNPVELSFDMGGRPFEYSGRYTEPTRIYLN